MRPLGNGLETWGIPGMGSPIHDTPSQHTYPRTMDTAAKVLGTPDGASSTPLTLGRRQLLALAAALPLGAGALAACGSAAGTPRSLKSFLSVFVTLRLGSEKRSSANRLLTTRLSFILA